MLAWKTLLFALLATVSLHAGSELRDLEGASHGLLSEAPGKATVLIFVMRDCPISNQFAPEINRICTEYEEEGVRCFLTYVDPDASAAELREHMREFSYDCCPGVLDANRKLTDAAGATITPEAAVFSPNGELLYRGRINNLYAALGKKRRAPTEHDLRRALDEILTGEPVSVPRTQAIGCYVPPQEL